MSSVREFVDQLRKIGETRQAKQLAMVTASTVPLKFRSKLFTALSQCANVLCGGEPDESLSARMWRTGNKKWATCIDKLFGAGHCENTYISQRARQEIRYKINPPN